MTIRGVIFVMGGGYRVKFFGMCDLPNLIGKIAPQALLAQWTHRITAYLIVVTLFTHWGLGIRHQLRHRDRYLQRMLPFTHQK